MHADDTIVFSVIIFINLELLGKRKGQGRVGTREVELDLSTRRKDERTSGYKQNRGKLQRFHSSFQTPRSLQVSVFMSILLMRSSGDQRIYFVLSHTHP